LNVHRGEKGKNIVFKIWQKQPSHVLGELFSQGTSKTGGRIAECKIRMGKKGIIAVGIGG